MTKLTTTFAALALLLTSFSPAMHAQSASSDVAGTWYFFLTLDGQPACQCIEITKFSPDGTLNGPANDHFSGDYIGIWTQTGFHAVSASLVQNNINPDGTAGGLYITKFTMTIGTGGDQASGTGTVQLVDNTGAVQFSDTYSFKGTKLKLP
jgi:hypothetical protein